MPVGDQPARCGEDKRHRHIGGILGQHAGRIGDDDPALASGLQVDMAEAGAVIGDQAEAIRRFGNQIRGDPVGHCGHQYVAIRDRRGQLLAAQRRIVGAQRDIEQFRHARFDMRRKRARDENARTGGAGGLCHKRRIGRTGRRSQRLEARRMLGIRIGT